MMTQNCSAAGQRARESIPFPQTPAESTVQVLEAQIGVARQYTLLFTANPLNLPLSIFITLGCISLRVSLDTATKKIQADGL